MAQNLVIVRPDTAVSRHRGDIIVDASVLFKLTPDIPASDNSSPKKKYLEILPFLAKNGYRIIIPEMVAFEAGQITGSGFDAGDLFRSNGRFQYEHDIKKMLKDAALPENSADKKNKNINILSGAGPQEVNDFCDKVKRALEKYNYEIEREPNRPEQLNIRSAARKNFMEIIKGSSQKGRGDDAIISLIERDYKDKKIGKPVFVLVDDIGLNLRIADFPHIKPVTTSELVYGLVQAGLGKDIGFPATIDAHDLDRKRRIDGSMCNRTNKPIPELIHKNEDAHMARIKDSPFTKSLEQLKEYLEKQQVGQSSIDDNISYREQLRKKFGIAKREHGGGIDR